MPVARQLVNHLLGQGDINTVDALKRYLGVTKLDLTIVESMDEYLEMIATGVYVRVQDSPIHRSPDMPTEPV